MFAINVFCHAAPGKIDETNIKYNKLNTIFMCIVTKHQDCHCSPQTTWNKIIFVLVAKTTIPVLDENVCSIRTGA